MPRAQQPHSRSSRLQVEEFYQPLKNFRKQNKILTLVRMDIQATKIELMRMILGIDNPSVLEKISPLIKKETSDFWDELTPEQQKDMEKAIKELDAGEGMEWSEVKKSI